MQFQVQCAFTTALFYDEKMCIYLWQIFENWSSLKADSFWITWKSFSSRFLVVDQMMLNNIDKIKEFDDVVLLTSNQIKLTVYGQCKMYEQR